VNIFALKNAVRKRDGYRCVECGLTNSEHLAQRGCQLEVHRVVPGSAYSVEPGACQTLCRPCHVKKPKRPPGTAYEVLMLPVAYRNCLRQLQDQIEERLGFRPTMSSLFRKALRDLFVKHGIKPPPRH
jgi:hypothetical protein